MRFTWDPRKSAHTLATRGFDFAFAARIFTGATLERDDLRHDYGERRRIALGRTHGLTLTVVYTDRTTADGESVRHLISARLSSRRERKVYAEAFPDL